MAFGNPDTGNGTTISFATGFPLGGTSGTTGPDFDGILVTGIDFGEITRPTLPYQGLNDVMELHHPGDSQTARALTITGLADVADPEDEWPQINVTETVGSEVLDVVSAMTLTLPGGVTYKDDGYNTSVAGPNFVNNELLVLTVVYQTNQKGTSRGWSTVV